MVIVPKPSHVILLLLATTVMATADENKERRKPNIIVFLMDDVGMGDIGCFGNTTINTPNIDQLAKEGAKLTQHIAHPICTPSRAALMTGRYAIRSGMTSFHLMRVISFISAPAGLPSNETTIAEVAKDVGYSTALIGKWHLGFMCEKENECSDPNSQGFDYFYGLPLTNILDCGHGTVFEAWRRNFYIEVAVTMVVLALATFILFMYSMVRRRTLVAVVVASTSFYLFCLIMPKLIAVMNCVVVENHDVVEQPLSYTNLTQRHTQHALDFLEEHKNEPFLLVMSFLQAHTELYAEPHFHARSQHGVYGAAVEELDWSVGEIMGALHWMGVADDTFVYLTSDNGAHVEEFSLSGEKEGGSNGIYKGGKANCFEGGIRVPTIVRYPGIVPPESEVSEPTNIVDLLPTVVGLTGGKMPRDRVIDGKDMMPLLQGELGISPHEFMFLYCGGYIHGARYRPRKGNRLYKIVYTTANLVEGPHGTMGCFDSYPCRCEGPTTVNHDPPLVFELRSDPSETTPLDPTTPNIQEIIAKARVAVAEHQASIAPTPYQFAPTRLLPRFGDQPCCGTFPFCSCTEDHSTRFSYEDAKPDKAHKDWMRADTSKAS